LITQQDNVLTADEIATCVHALPYLTWILKVTETQANDPRFQTAPVHDARLITSLVKRARELFPMLQENACTIEQRYAWGKGNLISVWANKCDVRHGMQMDGMDWHLDGEDDSVLVITVIFTLYTGWSIFCFRVGACMTLLSSGDIPCVPASVTYWTRGIESYDAWLQRGTTHGPPARTTGSLTPAQTSAYIIVGSAVPHCVSHPRFTAPRRTQHRRKGLDIPSGARTAFVIFFKCDADKADALRKQWSPGV